MISRHRSLLWILAILLIVAVDLRADCGATATITNQELEGGDLHATGTGTGANCFQSAIHIEVRKKGFPTTIWNDCPVNTSCTATGELSFMCQAPGTYKIEAYATCFKDCGSGCCAPDNAKTYEFEFIQTPRAITGSVTLAKDAEGRYVVNSTYESAHGVRLPPLPVAGCSQ